LRAISPILCGRGQKTAQQEFQKLFRLFHKQDVGGLLEGAELFDKRLQSIKIILGSV
jgi:hypothetical protein